MKDFHLVGWLVLLLDDKILLARRAGVSYGDGHWGVPGGHVEQGETLAAAACRETAEEVGISVDPDDLTPIGMARYTDGPMAGVDLFFRSARFRGEPRPVGECDRVGWFSLDALPSPVLPWLPSTLERVLVRNEWYEEVLG